VLETNPLRTGIIARPSPAPCTVAIFGATGDLTGRKLLPALYNLAHAGQLPTGFAIVGFARRPKGPEAAPAPAEALRSRRAEPLPVRSRTR
jgi:glucose-6-phosphate 1-dehydrogenase